MNADKIPYAEAKQRCLDRGLKPARSIAGCLEMVADYEVRLREQERLAAVGAAKVRAALDGAPEPFGKEQGWSPGSASRPVHVGAIEERVMAHMAVSSAGQILSMDEVARYPSLGAFLEAKGAFASPPDLPRKPLTKALRRKQLRKHTRKRQRMAGGR